MTEWRKAGESPRPMMAMAAAEVQPLAQVVGDIPDEHVITVAERRVSVDYPTIIQNNMNTDTVDLVLDGEWDGMSVVCYIGHPGDLGEFEWEGKPFTLPVYDTTGSIDVTVVGLSADGKTRLVTVEAKGVMNVIKSGEFEGSVPPEDQPDLLGQILAAKGEAEDAADEANSAASTANSAASKANSAASSANSAATSANSAATKANSAAVDAQNAYDTLQPYMATIDSCANILHSEVGPDSVVTADDSFPCKPVEMVVYGNTVQNLWVNPSGTKTQNGMTVTPNSDGSITVSGTSTSSALIELANSYALKPGAQYTFSVDKLFPTNEGKNTGGFFIQKHIAGQVNTTIGYLVSDAEKEIVVSVPSDTEYCVFGVQVIAGSQISGTYRVMLNEGSEPEPWCPPGLNSVGDGGSVKVVTAGKNLFTPNSITQIQGNGGSNQIAFIGTKVSGIPTQRDVMFSLEYRLSSGDGSMTIQQLSKPYMTLGIGYLALIGDGQWHKVSGKVTVVDNFNKNDNVAIRLDNVTGLFEFRNIQLELGSTATDYEPPNITTTTIDLQGHTLNSLPDGTRDELHIDGGGNVVLEKRVHREHIDADDFIKDHVDYSSANISSSIDSAYKGGVMSRPSDQRNDFAPIGNADADEGYAKASVYTLNDVTYYRVGDGTQSSTSDEQLASVKAKIGAKGIDAMWALLEPQTISLGTITPPTMAAPNVTAYVADDTPAEIELDYVRDINVVVDRLEKKVAGTAATVAINEATR